MCRYQNTYMALLTAEEIEAALIGYRIAAHTG